MYIILPPTKKKGVYLFGRNPKKKKERKRSHGAKLALRMPKIPPACTGAPLITRLN
jgi:hypothetical protein